MPENEHLLGRVKNVVVETMRRFSHGPSTTPKQLLITDHQTVFEPTYRIEDVLDVNRETKEIETLVKKLKGYQDEVSQGPKLITEAKGGQAFMTAEQRFIAMRDYAAALDGDYATLRSGDQPFYYSYMIRYQMLGVTAALIMHENIAKIMRLGKKYSAPPSYYNYFSLQEDIFTGELGVRIGDLTLADLLDANVTAKFAPHQIYQFLMETEIVKAQKKHEDVLKSNRDSNSSTHYPNLFKRKVDVACHMAYALIYCIPDQFDDMIGTYGNNKEVTERAKRLVGHIAKVRQYIYQTLLNPHSPHFPKLKDAVEYYLTQDRHTAFAALSIVGLKETSHIYEVYRQAHSYSQQGIFPEFFDRLAEAAKKYAEEVPTSEGVLTENDLPELLDPNKESANQEDIPTFEDFSKVIGQIFSKTSTKDYELDVDSINWDQLIPPQAARISFDPSNPKKFTVQLNYFNEYGESNIVTFEVDLRKAAVGWSFIETPDEAPKFLSLRNSFLLITQAVLLNMQRQVQEDYEQKQKDKPETLRSPAAQSQKQEKVRPASSLPKRRDIIKEVRKQNDKESPTPPEFAEINDLLESTVKKHIIIPSHEEQTKLTRKLSYEDQAKVFQAIEQFNAIQLGKFLPKKSRGPNGEILWTLDVSSRVPGRIRVLVTPSESEDKLTKFTVLDIDYRKDIYRRWHI